MKQGIGFKSRYLAHTCARRVAKKKGIGNLTHLDPLFSYSTPDASADNFTPDNTAVVED